MTAQRPAGRVGGTEIVFAPRALRLDDAAAAALASWPGATTCPHAGTRFGAGDPLCSVTRERARCGLGQDRSWRGSATPCCSSWRLFDE